MNLQLIKLPLYCQFLDSFLSLDGLKFDASGPLKISALSLQFLLIGQNWNLEGTLDDGNLLLQLGFEIQVGWLKIID